MKTRENTKTCKHNEGYWQMLYIKGWYQYDNDGNFTGESSANGDNIIKKGTAKYCVLCDKKI